MRILVHAPNWVGDHVMAYPFYFTLNELFGKSDIYLIGRKWIASLYPPFFKQVIAFSHGKEPSPEEFHFLKSLTWDYAFTLSPSIRSALLLWRLKAHYRIGQRDKLRSLILRLPPQRGSLRLPPPYPWEHRSLSYIRLLTPFFPTNQLAEDYWQKYRHLKVSFPVSRKFLQKKEVQLIRRQYPQNFILGICPGSVVPSKIYPVEHIQRVIELFLEKYPKSVILFLGSHIEKEYVQKITTAISPNFQNRLLDFTTKTNLTEAGFLLQHCHVLLANDSGLAHLSSLSHTPLVSFQGMGRKEETLPLNPQKIIFHKQLRCSPCFQKKCPRRDYPLECLVSIPPQEVFAAIENFLGEAFHQVIKISV
ncbi:MAG: glycosyltransferase family 9 protein [Leptospiraceae bacterium]|nr:glycosyltransferase family 9 protein [Leptospiraceae bacterium]